MNNNNRIDTSLVLCLAVLLITNSHFDALYPDPRLGTGGALGNALFFLLSGYGLAISLNSGRASGESFFSYWVRRLARIYPVLWLVSLLVIFIRGEWVDMALDDWLLKLIWPAQYWFLCAIVFYYALFYWVGKFGERRLLFLIVLLSAAYFLYYLLILDLNQFSIEDGYFKWLVYFQIMLFGAWLSKRQNLPAPARDASLLVLCVLVFYGLKVWMNIEQYWKLQFLLHLILFPFAFFTFGFLSSKSVVNFIRKIGIYPGALFLSGLTLEIYLVQVPLVPVIARQFWSFPIGWFVAILLIPMLALLAKNTSAYITGIRIFRKT